MLDKLEKYLDLQISILPNWLKDHLMRTSDVAQFLAKTHHSNLQRCKIGALGHDIAKIHNSDKLIKIVKENNLICSDFELLHPEVLHGPIAAFELSNYIKSDSSLYNSIRWHTSGHIDFDTENKIVFLADKLDPYKIEKRSELKTINDIAFKDLDKAIIAFFEIQFDFLKKNNIDIHPESKKYYKFLI